MVCEALHHLRAPAFYNIVYQEIFRSLDNWRQALKDEGGPGLEMIVWSEIILLASGCGDF